jgi:alanine racemase
LTDSLRRSWAVVNLDAIAHNISVIKNLLAPSTMLMGVVKADAYGHGDKYIAEQLVRQGVSWFGVSNLGEALSLRRQGIYHPMLIFGFTPAEHAPLLNEYNLTQTVYSLEYAQRLQESAAAAGVDVGIHIKLDTGMSRLGFVLDDDFAAVSAEEIARVYAMPNLRPGGIFTHFAVADEKNEDSVDYTRRQFHTFMEFVDALAVKGMTFPLRHCCNSAGTLCYPEMHLDMVRPGVVLYGLAPSDDCVGIVDLRPAMEFYSCISMVKEIAAGTSVSYGRFYTAKRKMRIATVPVGYADGYERELSNKSRVLVRGEYAPVIGRVCMDMMMLDVTHIPGVASGDIVTIVGEDGGKTLTFDEMARLSGSINYEKVCLIGKRVPRIYRQNGKDIGVMDFIANRE